MFTYYWPWREWNKWHYLNFHRIHLLIFIILTMQAPTNSFCNYCKLNLIYNNKKRIENKYDGLIKSSQAITCVISHCPAGRKAFFRFCGKRNLIKIGLLSVCPSVTHTFLGKHSIYCM